MKKLVIILAICGCLIGCTDSNNTKRVLEEQGYTNIVITGYNYFACSDDDAFHTGFIATNSVGNTVEGTVCSGLLLKNSTIRFK